MSRLTARAARLGFILVGFIFPTVTMAGSCACLVCLLNPDIENFQAAGESMAPTIDTGDCAVMRYIDPVVDPIQRGDVIGFVPRSDQTIFVFRVIAIAGDTIALRDGNVILNGQPLTQRLQGRDEFIVTQQTRTKRCETPAGLGDVCTRTRFTESLPNGISYEVFDIGAMPGDDMTEIEVPPSHVFVMGDHRDNALDSRVSHAAGGPGLISLQQIRGVFDSF